MAFMKDKLISDFLNADRVDSLIITKEIPLSQGVEILNSLIIKIRNDIKNLDEDKYKILNSKIEDLNKRCNEKKNIIKKSFEKKPDVSPFDEEKLIVNLANEQHEMLQQLLVIIQDICYRAGWFD